MKTIIRVNKNSSGVKFMFQAVEYFHVVRNENIQYLEDRSQYSDWIHSGDLINCEFIGNRSAITFDLAYKDGLELDMPALSLSDYQVKDLQKEINQFKRVVKKLNQQIEATGEYIRTMDESILVNLLFNALNVIGGTLEIDNTRYVYNGCNKQDFINMILDEVIK